MLTQLVYTSRPRFDVSNAAGQGILEQIAQTARRYNGEHDISGVLLAGPGWLAQVLEGEPEALTPLITRILADSRHDCVVIIEMRRIDQRRFGRWALGVSTCPMNQLPVDRLGVITADELAELGKIAP